MGIDGLGPLRILFEGQDSRSHVLAGQATQLDSSLIDEWSVLQLFASVTLPNLMGTGLRADGHFGRMTLDANNLRLITRNLFRNTTNNFEGLHLQLSQEKDWLVRTFFVRPVVRFLFETDTGDTDSLFWGVSYETRDKPWFQRDLYYYGLNDRDASTTSPTVVYHTFGLRLFKVNTPGELDYEIESDWQVGSFGQKDHFAHYQHVELGYTFNTILAAPFVISV